jgi:hypothetical protein
VASKQAERAEQETDHGVQDGFYDTFLNPTLVCGYQASGSTWEEAGADLDAHLEEEDE